MPQHISGVPFLRPLKHQRQVSVIFRHKKSNPLAYQLKRVEGNSLADHGRSIRVGFASTVLVGR